MNFGVWIPNCRHWLADIIRSTAVRAEQSATIRLGQRSLVVPHANVTISARPSSIRW